MKEGGKWLILSAIISMATLGGIYYYFSRNNNITNPIAVKVMVLEKDTVENVINDTGIVQLGEQQILKSPLEGGIVEQVLVQTGDNIRSNQLLLILRDARRQMALSQQPLEIEKQRVKIDRSQKQELEASQQLNSAKQELQSLKSTEAKINQEELQLFRNQEKIQEFTQLINTAKLELNDFKKLQEQGAIPVREVRTKEEQILNLQSQQKDAQVAVKTNRLVIKQLKTELQSQKQELSDAIFQAQAQLQDIKLSTNQERLELKRLQLELKTIEEESKTPLIQSTINGRILDISIKVGDVTKLGDPLLTIGEPSMELVKVELSPLEAKGIEIDQTARVTTIGANSQTFNGKVKQIADLAIASDSSGETNTNKINNSSPATVTVTVKLDQLNGNLIPGSQVDVKFLIDQRQDVVTLNREIIQSSGKETFVWIKNQKDQVEKRQVTLGLEGLTSVEVRSGLSFGEQVILPSSELKLKPGIPIIVQK